MTINELISETRKSCFNNSYFYPVSETYIRIEIICNTHTHIYTCIYTRLNTPVYVYAHIHTGRYTSMFNSSLTLSLFVQPTSSRRRLRNSGLVPNRRQTTAITSGVRLTMMTSSNENIFRVTGHLYREFTGHRWVPRTKASNAELWCFLWSAPD